MQLTSGGIPVTCFCSLIDCTALMATSTSLCNLLIICGVFYNEMSSDVETHTYMVGYNYIDVLYL